MNPEQPKGPCSKSLHAWLSQVIPDAAPGEAPPGERPLRGNTQSRDLARAVILIAAHVPSWG